MDEEAQASAHRRWVEQEGGIEGPTHQETIDSPEQRRRSFWLRINSGILPVAPGAMVGYEDLKALLYMPLVKDVLEIGCNTGWQLDRVFGRCGVDINPENIRLAREGYPDREFVVGDVTKGLPFLDASYAVVMEPDILEHLAWPEDVWKALDEGLRIARNKLLITLPWRKDNKCALSMKHVSVPDGLKFGQILVWLTDRCKRWSCECDGDFVYLEVVK